LAWSGVKLGWHIPQGDKNLASDQHEQQGESKMSTTIRQILEGKDHQIYSVSPDDMVFDAIKLMSEVGVGALLVIENNRLAGIISERDYTRKVILQNRSSRDTPVRSIMTEKVIFMGPDRTVDECMVLMSKHNIRHMPIVENGVTVGVVTVMDVMKNIIMEKEFIIHQLENYISGAG